MKTLPLTICLTLTVLLGSTGTSWSADYEKGVAAYYNGDYATALREFRPLAEQGDAPAQFNLGGMYRNGEGVPQDYKEAVKWYQLAAEQGHVSAQYIVGAMYVKGQGVPQDSIEAFKWLRLAAEQGHAYAQNFLGLMYENGFGVSQDYIRAHMWLTFAVASGVDDARANRDILAKKMTPSQIEKAQALAQECIRKDDNDLARYYKYGC